MTIPCRAPRLRPPCQRRSVRVSERAVSSQKAIASTLTLLLCAVVAGCCQPNDPSCRNVAVGPSKGEFIGIAVGVGAGVATVVAVEVYHAHHTLKGCVAGTPGGQELKVRSGAKTYVLSGNVGSITSGEKVRLSGKRFKKPQSNTSDAVFLVDRVSKRYGLCASHDPLSASTP